MEETSFLSSVIFDKISADAASSFTPAAFASTDFICPSTAPLNPTFTPKEKSATAERATFRSALTEIELEAPTDNEFLIPANISFFMPKYSELLMPMLWLKSVPHVSLVLLPRVMEDECP